MPERFRDAFAEVVCSRQMSLAIGIGIFVILSFMMGISLWVTEPGSPSHTLAAMNIASLFGLIVVCVALILYCQA
jgi:hypothetical protein